MVTWRFYQGLRTEWRWYQFDQAGEVIAESDRGFAELQGCMANAESAGFTGEAYQVLAREGGAFPDADADADDSEPESAQDPPSSCALNGTLPD